MIKLKFDYQEIICEPKDGGLISGPEDLAEAIGDDANDIQENLWLITLGPRGDMQKRILVAKGGSNSVNVTPATILRLVLLSGSCTRFAVSHNHPSADASPSEEDMMFTRRLISATKMLGMELVDHIIVTPNKGQFFSFSREGLL